MNWIKISENKPVEKEWVIIWDDYRSRPVVCRMTSSHEDDIFFVSMNHKLGYSINQISLWTHINKPTDTPENINWIDVNVKKPIETEYIYTFQPMHQIVIIQKSDGDGYVCIDDVWGSRIEDISHWAQIENPFKM